MLTRPSIEALTAGHRFTCAVTFKAHWHLLPVRVNTGRGGGAQEHRNGNACNTPRVTDYKTPGCYRGEKAVPGATKTSCQKFTRVCMCVRASSVCSDFCGGRGNLPWLWMKWLITPPAPVYARTPTYRGATPARECICLEKQGGEKWKYETKYKREMKPKTSCRKWRQRKMER